MINGKFTLKWKITKVLDTPPSIHQDNIVFNLSQNTGLYSQFSLPKSLGYVPHLLEPTVVFHQVIKNELAKQDIKIINKKFPYNIDVPNLNAQVLLNIKIRLYPTNILSLTVTVSGFPSTLDAVELINYQRLDKLEPIPHIIQWTIGMVETLDHKNFNPSQPLRSKSIVYLDGVCRPEDFKNHIKENVSQYVGILIRNDYYKTMDEEIQRLILEKNKDHNLKFSQELLLIDKQGILYVKPTGTMAPKSRFSKIQELYEIAIIFGEFLSNDLSFHIQKEDLANFNKIRQWIEDPEAVFRYSVEHKKMWKLLLREFELKAIMQSAIKRKQEIEKNISDKAPNTVFMRDHYNIGQAGAVGPRAHAHDMTFQIWNENKNDIDLSVLAKELAKLRTELKKEASELDHDISIGAIASAENSARESNGPKAFEYLSKTGKWALDIATKIGVPVATEVLKKVIGL